MSTKPPDLILLKGAPGVGKSSVARELAHHFPSGVRVEVDDLRKMVINVKWTDQGEHRKLLNLAAQLAVGFLNAGFGPVILVDTFSGDKLDDFLKAFSGERPESRVFIAALRASDEALRDRVMNREAGGFRDLAISRRINQEVACDVWPSGRLIDTTLLMPTEVAQSIVAAVCE